jgi:hypothetical protein
MGPLRTASISLGGGQTAAERQELSNRRADIALVDVVAPCQPCYPEERGLQGNGTPEVRTQDVASEHLRDRWAASLRSIR